MYKARKIIVRGRVQGVGFRPFVYQLAEKLMISGTVQNNMDGVNIHIEGNEADLDAFLYELKHDSPRLSRIDEVVIEQAQLQPLLFYWKKRLKLSGF